MDILSPMASVPRVDSGRFSLSVVVPVYNEVAVLPEFHRRLGAVLEEAPEPAQDGRTPGSEGHRGGFALTLNRGSSDLDDL
jgi:hypothetical protein